MLAKYCVMRPVLGSYVKPSESAEPYVTPVASLKPLYVVAVTGFWPVEAETVLARPSPSGAYVQVGIPVMLGLSVRNRF